MSEKGGLTISWRHLLIGTVALLLVGSLVFHFWLGPQMALANRDAGSDIIDSTMNADNAIDNYEWFKQQEQDIVAARQNANATRAQIEQFHSTYGDDPDDWSRTAENQHGELHQQLLGIQQQHNNYVADYNARSSMQNRAVFKDKLPYEMEKKFWTGDLR